VRKILALLLCLTLLQAIWAAEVVSVRSTDRDNNSNTVNIDLSGATQYRTEKLPGGKGIRLIIQNVDKLGASPQYPRLSEVVDNVSARMEGSNAIIDIKTMGSYNISHHASSDQKRISVSIDANPAPKEVSPAPKSEPAPKPKTQIPDGAMPRKANEPEMARGLPPQPGPGLGKLKTEKEPETPEKARPEESPAEAREDKQVPQPQQDLFDEDELEEAEDSPLETQKPQKKGSLALWLFIAAAGLLSLVVIFQFFIKKDRHKETEAPTVVTPPSPREGHTLLLDPETRKRMVQKLLDQGWSTSEIAREIRLNPDQVEEIVASLREHR